MPTRFLDWTSNALTALWFALGREESSYDDTGASEVWILETANADFEIPKGERSPIPSKKGSRTVIFTPQMIDCRILAQDSYMMRQVYEQGGTGKDKTLAIQPVNENPTFNGRIHKVLVTSNVGVRHRMQNDLKDLGYDKERILPDERDWHKLDERDWHKLMDECDNLAKSFSSNQRP